MPISKLNFPLMPNVNSNQPSLNCVQESIFPQKCPFSKLLKLPPPLPHTYTILSCPLR